MKQTQTGYLKLEIRETARDNLNDEPRRYSDVITETFKSMNELKEFLVDRYGHVPGGRNKIYRDKADGSAQEVGFLYSFWNKDWSHDSKSWYQTDWIEATNVAETPVLIQEVI